MLALPADGDAEAEAESDAETDGLSDGEADALGERDADGDNDGDAEADADDDGLIDGDAEALADEEGDRDVVAPGFVTSFSSRPSNLVATAVAGNDPSVSAVQANTTLRMFPSG